MQPYEFLAVVWNQFMFAGYVTFRRRRLGAMLSDWHVIKITVLCMSFKLKS